MEASGHFHATADLLLGKEPQYLPDRRLGGPRSRSDQRGDEKILDPTGTRQLCNPTRNCSKITDDFIKLHSIEITQTFIASVPPTSEHLRPPAVLVSSKRVRAKGVSACQ
jgi:hypothetical protein